MDESDCENNPTHQILRDNFQKLIIMESNTQSKSRLSSLQYKKQKRQRYTVCVSHKFKVLRKMNSKLKKEKEKL